MLCPCTGRQRQIKYGPLAFSDSLVLCPAGTWIAETGMLMDGNIRGFPLFLKGGLNAITVMCIKIEHTDTTSIVLVLPVACRNDTVVKKTKAIGLIRFGMMARWTCLTKNYGTRIMLNGIDTNQARTC